MGFAGIDLGNTGTKVAVIDSQGNPVLQPNSVGELVTRSCVFFDKGRVIVGSEALNAGLLDPSRSVQDWKRHMGTAKVLCSAEGKDYRAKDVAALLLKHAADNYLAKTGEVLTRAAISVPANYSDGQKAETLEAARQAGIEVVCTPHEPTAAIYGNRVEKRGDGIVVILDLGGSTFDVSLVTTSGNVLDVRATNGEPQLGGQDFNRRFLDMVLEKFKKEHGFVPNPKEHSLELYQLNQHIESAKVTLSVRDNASVTFACRGKVVSVALMRQEFSTICHDLVQKAMERARQTLQEAGVSPKDVREFLPVGGASQMPCFLDAVEATFGKRPSVVTEPFFAVALGAASMGRQAIEEQDGHFEVKGRRLPAFDYQLRDVTQHALGVAALHDNFELRNATILKKGAPFPSDQTCKFYLAEPGQTEAHIEVLQGEGGLPAPQCHSLGKFKLSDIDPVFDRPHPIDVRCRIDRNGMLTASARDSISGREAELTLDYKQAKKSA